MNILLTCVGRRNQLVQFFKRALGQRGQVVACDSSAAAPALAEADQALIVPRIQQPDYFDAMLTICRGHVIGLYVTVHDYEISLLTHQARRFREAGTIPLVASPRAVATCLDKWATFQFLKSCAIPTPDTYLSAEAARHALALGLIKFPLVIKPRWGFSSERVECVENERELALAQEWGQNRLRRNWVIAALSAADPDNCLVIQEYLQGQEYGMDVVNDLDGRHVATLGRRKLVMRAGATDRAVTVADTHLERLGAQIGVQLAHIGSLDCDVMATDRGHFVLDMNPRIGGGYPFSHVAGANLPAALIAWANREEPDPSWLKARPGVYASKGDHVQVIEPPASDLEAKLTRPLAVEPTLAV